MWPLLFSPNANFIGSLHVYFRKRTSGTLLYQIAACLGDVSKKNIQAELNGSRISLEMLLQ